MDHANVSSTPQNRASSSQAPPNTSSCAAAPAAARAKPSAAAPAACEWGAMAGLRVRSAGRVYLAQSLNVARAAASSSHGSRREQPSCSCAPARPHWPPPACPAPVGSGPRAAAARWLRLAAAGPRLLPASAAAPPPARLATAKAAAAGPQAAAAAARSRTARALRPLAPAGAACGFGYPLLRVVRTCTAAGRLAARPGRKGEGRASCAAGGISDGGF